jgi:nitroreductase
MRNQSEPSNFAAIKTPISHEALDQLFYDARTHSAWLPEPVPVELLRKAYELARLGPTSANGSSARFAFLTTRGIPLHGRKQSRRQNCRDYLTQGSVNMTG